MVSKSELKLVYIGGDEKKKLSGRLNRVKGQIEGIKNMIESDKCVDDILIQISAAKSALTSFALDVVENHLVNCAKHCIENKRTDIIQRVARALAVVLKNA